ncbi:MAG: 30S ribosomal protein S16 [Acidobacteriota bacterium]
MLKIRLRRMGSRHRPFYRVVVSDSRRRPTSSALEEVVTYDPRQRPSRIDLKLDRIDHWLGHGAQPSETVSHIVAKARRAPAAPEATETVEEAPAAEATPAAEAAPADEAAADDAVEAAAAAETADEAPAEAAEADTAAEADEITAEGN